MVMMVICGLLVGCGAPSRSGRSVLSEASDIEFGGSGGLCPDTVAIAGNSKIDYEKLLDGCIARQPESMSTFFWLSKHAGFDGASSEGHAAVTGVLLRELGDAFFGECLAREDLSVRDAVREDLLYDLGYGNTEVTLSDIQRKYPITFPKDWMDQRGSGQ